jgi:thiamine kinase-like enzyme
MAEPITTEEQITPDWLMNILRQNGHLVQGSVIALDKECFKTLFSLFYRLEAHYSNDAAPALPSKMLLKLPLPDNEASLKMGKDEVFVYNTLTKSMNDPPVVPFFDAVHSPITQRWQILMEDLSNSHFQPEVPVPPSRRHCELCVETLAQFHAFWWEHPSLGAEIGQLLDTESLTEIVAQIRKNLSSCIDYLGDRLSPNRRRAYEEAMEFALPFFMRRLTSIERNTLIHGDAHMWNFLHPKDPEKGRAFLIDLATSNRIRPPTNDLAYMIALQWYPERRDLMEESLIRHYHSSLLSYGVKGYAWEDCWLDYRLSVISHMFTPVFQWAGGQIPASVWWHNLERISEAYKDLNCAELL